MGDSGRNDKQRENSTNIAIKLLIAIFVNYGGKVGEICGNRSLQRKGKTIKIKIVQWRPGAKMAILWLPFFFFSLDPN